MNSFSGVTESPLVMTAITQAAIYGWGTTSDPWEERIAGRSGTGCAAMGGTTWSVDGGWRLDGWELADERA